MTSNASSTRVSRRLMVSALAALPAMITLRSAGALAQSAAADGLLASWNDTAFKNAVMAFISRVTKQGSPDFVPEAERIAAFDDDGTLWAELPTHFQFLFALYRVNVLDRQPSALAAKEPISSLRNGDVQDTRAGDTPEILPTVMATHTGMTCEQVDRIVRDWIFAARHPITGQAYAEMAHQPMLELVALLRENGFRMRYGDGVALHLPVVLSLTI
jgi:hypothetical protein